MSASKGMRQGLCIFSIFPQEFGLERVTFCRRGHAQDGFDTRDRSLDVISWERGSRRKRQVPSASSPRTKSYTPASWYPAARPTEYGRARHMDNSTCKRDPFGLSPPWRVPNRAFAKAPPPSILRFFVSHLDCWVAAAICGWCAHACSHHPRPEHSASRHLLKAQAQAR